MTSFMQGVKASFEQQSSSGSSGPNSVSIALIVIGSVLAAVAMGGVLYMMVWRSKLMDKIRLKKDPYDDDLNSVAYTAVDEDMQQAS